MTLKLLISTSASVYCGGHNLLAYNYGHYRLADYRITHLYRGFVFMYANIDACSSPASFSHPGHLPTSGLKCQRDIWRPHLYDRRKNKMYNASVIKSLKDHRFFKELVPKIVGSKKNGKS